MVPEFMSRFLTAVFIAVFTLPALGASIVPAPPQLDAKAYLLMDAASGEVLVEHNADMPLPPASLTKMMTAYVLAAEMEAGRIAADDMGSVSRNAWAQNPVFNGSSLMWIEPGMDVSVADLERGIVISSGNDATVAIAEHIAGTEAAFADMMNSYAEALGMSDTYYQNSHGLPAPDHITTARDLAILARAMIKNFPEHYKIYAERQFTYNDIRQYNRNSLLGEDPSVDGLKTGYTREAGYCLVASAERRDMRLVSVVMGTRSPNARKNQTRSLLNYGFRFYETTTQFAEGGALDEVRVWKGVSDTLSVGVREPVVLTLPRGKEKHLKTVVTKNESIIAPLAVGDALGSVALVLDEETLYETPLVALEAVEQAGFFARLWDSILMWFSKLFSA